MISGKKMIFKINRGVFFQVFVAFIGNLMSISDGMTLGWTSPMIPFFLSKESHISMTLNQAVWLELSYPIGTWLGVPFIVYLVNTTGKKKSLILSSFLMLIQWILIYIASNIYYLYVARLLAGMADNIAFVASLSYISEIANTNIRGFLSSFTFIFQVVGILVIYIIGGYFPYYTGSLFAGILLLIEIVVFYFLPETPHFLLSNNKREEAKQVLIKFRFTTCVEDELNEIAETIEKEKLEKGKISDIFTVQCYKKATIIIMVLAISQQIAGINVILMNLHSILKEAGSTYISPAMAAVLFSGLLVLSAIISSVIVDKFGRRKLLISSSILTLFFLLLIGIYFSLKNGGYNYEKYSWLPIASIMIYAIVFKIGLGMIPSVLTAEILSPKIQALIMSLSNVLYGFFGIVAIQIFIRLKDITSIEYPFYVFVVGLLLCIIYAIIYIPETKGKSLQDIQLILEGRHEDDC